MTPKKPDLDDATVRVMKRVLAMPPKPHGEMKAPVKTTPAKRAAKAKRRR